MDYRDFGGVKFPTRIVQEQGGFPTLELTVRDVQPNAPVNIEAPQAAPQIARAEAEKVADGIWHLMGTPDPNSQVVEFKDHACSRWSDCGKRSKAKSKLRWSHGRMPSLSENDPKALLPAKPNK